MRWNETTHPIWMTFFRVIGIFDIITCANFDDDRLRILGWRGVRLCPSLLTVIVDLATLSHYRARAWYMTVMLGRVRWWCLCSGVCDQGQFACGVGATRQCIPDCWICDNYNDCGDKSDETAELCGQLINIRLLNTTLFHDLLLRSYLYHCVWSVITAHNLTPENRNSRSTQ